MNAAGRGVGGADTMAGEGVEEKGERAGTAPPS
jgi:hypothetical protein